MTALTASTRLQLAIDRVIVAVPFDQACDCGQCKSMQELQQAAIEELRSRQGESPSGTTSEPGLQQPRKPGESPALLSSKDVSRHHIITQKPGEVPERKGTYIGSQTEEALRELYRLYPGIVCIVMPELPVDCWPQHGHEYLDMQDGERCLCDVDEPRNPKCPVDHTRRDSMRAHETTEDPYRAAIRGLDTLLRIAVSHLDMTALEISHRTHWALLTPFTGPAVKSGDDSNG